MSGRSRYQFGVLVLIILVALLALGCGGGDEKTTTTKARVVTTAAPSSSGSAADELIGTTVKPTEDTPGEFVDAYGVRPIVLLFYVPGGTDDISVSETLNALAPSFNKYLFLVYDYKAPEAYGDLSSLLKVDYPPALILIDRDGVIDGVWNGYIDEGTMNQALVNLERT